MRLPKNTSKDKRTAIKNEENGPPKTLNQNTDTFAQPSSKRYRTYFTQNNRLNYINFIRDYTLIMSCPKQPIISPPIGARAYQSFHIPSLNATQSIGAQFHIPRLTSSQPHLSICMTTTCKKDWNWGYGHGILRFRLRVREGCGCCAGLEAVVCGRGGGLRVCRVLRLRRERG